MSASNDVESRHYFRPDQGQGIGLVLDA